MVGDPAATWQPSTCELNGWIGRLNLLLSRDCDRGEGGCITHINSPLGGDIAGDPAPIWIIYCSRPPHGNGTQNVGVPTDRDPLGASDCL